VNVMAIIRKSDLGKMTPKEAQAKLVELDRVLLELQGEGKVDKVKPVKKAIAKLQTRLTMEKKKQLNTTSVPNNLQKK
jgi:ribosomal protein L29